MQVKWRNVWLSLKGFVKTKKIKKKKVERKIGIIYTIRKFSMCEKRNEQVWPARW